ncbi:phosphoenolpyruvate phosphomutase [Salinibacillus kushneri]|uniref:Phosphoenolpyruvate phosphomutase n=1 Tax=Salinibacillus kushneri TaxID=237682 RepID=A0A1I0EVZ2_9BACI|nr:isocitrate lyase/phosphoenolpyruvate mutase family protein [Salinibacillus kushneri]SET49306.1 phosphoenolpyruvate phosphomutase [Salinibacillus kushneri]
MKARNKMRQLINQKGKVIRAVGAHNGLTARLVERHNFDAVWASGFEISSSFAKPDANILSMTEFKNITENIIESTTLPVIADCDTGFGNVNNVIETVKKFENIGVSGISIEDKIFPKMNSFVEKGQSLISKKEFEDKLKAAKDTQIDPDLIIIARIESLIAGSGMDDALERAFAYYQAGADMILIHSKIHNPSEVLQFRKLWNYPTPVVIVPTTYPMFSVEEARNNDFKMLIYANPIIRSSVKAINDTLSKLYSSDSLLEIDDDLIDMSYMFDLQKVKEMV